MRQLAVVLLLLTALRAWADWTVVASSADADVYIDVTTVRKRGNMVKLWALMDYKTAQLDAVLTWYPCRCPLRLLQRQEALEIIAGQRRAEQITLVDVAP